MSEQRSYPKARKRFGQNFLHDEAVITDIIAAISPQKDQHLVEIGPGRGALTAALLADSARLDVIELDRDLVPILKNQFSESTNLYIHQADALEFDFKQLQQNDEKLRVIGNLPYNITTPLLFHLLDQATLIEDMCFMLQKEVVERICAAPGNKSYGRLSIMIQYQCMAEQLFIVPPTAFDPPPKVDSAIIYLQPRKQFVGGDVCIKTLGTLVTQAFRQRRKTIANTLKNSVSLSELERQGIDPKQRPETLSVEQYVALAQSVGA
ncbi:MULTISPECIES: 16S rRNA (adenine(1518)-N(6)/adenine(1519)-N(6))-dimethyltransferase RsmA [unclassified Methylophaga]|uniref:16S rRNA (adenine(1518)-N(6)/adenine(1519)-N(6))- dimethyltransferase RsmA n=1 Tax=unclassified Methylophaga TaxID=2629249 RepID=UPI000C953728|nr:MULTISPECIES: 16S rRNA (adenine(1518)-N(6)/adenine(1519)-N(6))-dimethyltransferase RsmA [unclassified Methylophaga]MBN47877.1 16S rRNA (adenine(1518)-N(6)/adenine(1519)-N(6))-dimethyltransferase [Methylophaga sp.]|tara:strand:+ start:19003 stop:19797 length:795 start_codon:yes stop_codon:yes gene_type:complete